VKWTNVSRQLTLLSLPLLLAGAVEGDGDLLPDLIVDGAALSETRIAGIESNIDYLRQLADSEVFRSGRMLTSSLATFTYTANSIEVLTPGTQTTVQDWPGRTGYWAVGVPPSGPMDALSFRLANRLAGNSEGTPALEITLSGPTLKFNADAVIALTGAAFDATLDGETIAFWRAVHVKAGHAHVVSLDVRYTGGTAWVCRTATACGAGNVKGSPDHTARAIDVSETAPRKPGSDGIFSVGAVTAAPPAWTPDPAP